MANPVSGFTKSLNWRLRLFASANKISVSACRYNPLVYAECMRKSYHLYRKHGFLPDEALRLGLFQSKDHSENRFVSKHHLVQLQKALNHESLQVITEDKALFYLYCTLAQIPIPRLLGIFLNKSSGFQPGRGSLSGEDQWAEFFEKDCPGEFVVKPSRGVYGDGIFFIDKSHREFSGRNLFRLLNSHPRYDSFVIQECLANHPDISALNPKKGLQTVRVITLVNKDQSVSILAAFFKPIAGDNRIDNHHNGATGNLLCPIRLEDGTLEDLYIMGENGVQRLDRHPDTGTRFRDNPMPLWIEICSLAKAAAGKFLPLRTIGWDIAACASGTYVIEGNARWDPLMFGNMSEPFKALNRAAHL
ncbi:MAG: sugar-transfer associated ATP-grasp domain-containing protein [Acidobacteriota bacterium]|nr:sugar-transfer associated ATP-grasp domain-containing protein [Acidobacteriota bacterium]NLT33778.1 hypothetical protein [Acidobacteriota bacterium]